MLKWFRRDKPISFKAELPGQETEPAIEPFSPTWKFLEAWSQKEVEDLRRKLESPKLDLPTTNLIRGQIKQMSRLMDLSRAGRVPPAQGILNRHYAGKE